MSCNAAITGGKYASRGRTGGTVSFLHGCRWRKAAVSIRIKAKARCGKSTPTSSNRSSFSRFHHGSERINPGKPARTKRDLHALWFVLTKEMSLEEERSGLLLCCCCAGRECDSSTQATSFETHARGAHTRTKTAKSATQLGEP